MNPIVEHSEIEILPSVLSPHLSHPSHNQPRHPLHFVFDWLFRMVIILSSLVLIYVSFRGNIFSSLLYAARSHQWFRLIEKPSILWVVMGTFMLFFRTLFWMGYKPIPSVQFEDAPHLTVIIPAYNEGPMVGQTIDSVAQASYPHDRLEIIAVDDGSRDDTWNFILKAAKRYPGLVHPIRFQKNKGKRAALEAGFKRCKGEFAITIDSDSIIDPGTLLAMVSPFRNPNVGAVAGKVAVLNKEEGFIPRMLQVRFVLSFDFLRAAQSFYGIVYCCPGALAAYRTSCVKKVLEKWMNQSFLGVRCTYGEDRALTNFILEQGFKTVYQRTGVVHTLVPTTYKKLCKMYLRWDRSYIREEVRLPSALRKQSPLAALYAMIDASLTNFRYPINWITLVLLAAMIAHDPYTVVRITLAIGIMALLNMLYYLYSERSWNFIYGVLYAYYAFFCLFWIFPYALITIRSRSWMTR